MRKVSAFLLCALLALTIGLSFQTRTLTSETCTTLVLDGPDFAVLDRYVTADTLVVLDLDNTVFRASTSMGSSEWFHHIFHSALDHGFDKPAAAALSYTHFSPMQQYVTVEPCEAGLPERIKSWQQTARSVIALTARQTKVLPRTIEHLNSIDVDFSDHPWVDKAISFDAVHPTSFYEGIIFAHDCNPKGEIFTQFLEQIDDSSIRRIVFVDDRQGNVSSMQAACQAKNIEFVGLRYSGQDDKYAGFDPAIADFQQHHAGTVIPDDLARQILELPEGQELLGLYKDPIANCVHPDCTLVNTKAQNSNSAPLLPSYDVAVEILESKHIADLLELADENTLVVFDLNDTLMRTDSSLGGDVWADQVCKQAMSTGMSKEEALDRLVPFWHQVLMRTSVQPVELDTAKVLHSLQLRGCKMMGLTARYIEMAYPTLEALQSLWIDFGKNSIAEADFTLRTPYPAKYLNGVVFAGLQNDKADVLVQFLQQKSVNYNKILFIDDKKKNVEGMIKAARALNKPYVGVWYRAVEATETPLDSDVAKLQQVLFDRIIPDSIAKELVSQGAWRKASSPTY